MSAAITELEDAIDCAGAAREDEEFVAVSVGAIREALDTIDAMRSALKKAGDQFAFYADEHAKKGTNEADAKAAVNHQWALDCAKAACATAPLSAQEEPS